MKVTFLLPLADNDGKSFPDSQINSILSRLTRQFHGCSTDGKVDGRSLDEGVEHHDISLRVTIVSEKDQLNSVRACVAEIGRELHQKSMYFEVRDYDGVQILPTGL